MIKEALSTDNSNNCSYWMSESLKKTLNFSLISALFVQPEPLPVSYWYSQSAFLLLEFSETPPEEQGGWKFHTVDKEIKLQGNIFNSWKDHLHISIYSSSL